VLHDHDRCGRALGEVLAGAKSLNLSQREAGEVARYPRCCSERRFATAEQTARTSQRGVRARAGLQGVAPLTTT